MQINKVDFKVATESKSNIIIILLNSRLIQNYKNCQDIGLEVD